MGPDRLRTRATLLEAFIGGAAGVVGLVGIAATSLWFLFFWQRPTDPSGALIDLVVQFYRPVLWAALVVVVLLLLVPVVSWAWSRTRSAN